ncbi:MAG TPA: helix-turn-helix domain-containing protein [Roseiflexaceae bacterium]|nr:helix-turn-helix domain-containing protein [Roseiflexaceae bacterium]
MTRPSEVLTTLGERIRAGRVALGLTQAALAAQVGCSSEMLRKFEADAKRPSLAVVERLADCFGMVGAERVSFLAAGGNERSTEPVPVPWFPRTKLQPPRLRSDLLARPRLVARLRDALKHARLILVAAPAGAGKTTLLTSALAEFSGDSAWISLDDDDNDPARFFAVLLAALDQLAPGAAAAALPLMHALETQQADRTTQVRQAVATLINAVMERLHAPGWLILDDLHVINEPLVHAALEYLMNQLPVSLTLVIATRHDPLLPLARLRARRELLEIRLPDLRFTAAETADLLTDCLGLPLSAGEVSALYQRTEGWAAGLSLLAASLTALESADERARFLAHLVQTDRYLFDYLAEEVLDRQDAATRSFLLDTAILPELTPQACQTITGREDAAALLDTLYRRNLFLVTLRSEQKVAYRYHDLFRAFLLERLRRDAPERLRELHRRAARSAADPQRATEHLLQAELWDAAADSIEAIGERLLISSAHHTARMLIEALPKTTVAARPRLRSILGRCALQRWDAAAAVGLLGGAAADFTHMGDTIGQGEALVFLSTALSRAGDLKRARDAAEQALLLPLAPPRRIQLLAERSWHHVIGGTWPQAVADLDEAISIVERAGDAGAFPALSVAVTGFLMGLPGGLARINRFSRLVETHAAPDDRLLHVAAAVMRAWAAIWSDRWVEADAENQRALELLAPIEAFTAMHAEIFIQQPVCAALQGNTALADEHFTRMLAALEQQDGLRRAWRISSLHALARVRWLQGKGDELRAIRRRMAAALNARVWPTDVALCREIGALVHLADGHVEPAIAELRVVADDQARVAIAPVLGDPRLHLAHAYLLAGHSDMARSAAGPALAAMRRDAAPGRLRWQGAALVIPILRLYAAGGPHAEFAATALAHLDDSAR